jgi:hypothetical protein
MKDTVKKVNVMANNWINVQDRMPEINQIVTIFTNKHEKFENMIYVSNGVFTRDDLECDYYLPEVSFWKC